MMAESEDNSECTVSQGLGIVSSVSGNCSLLQLLTPFITVFIKLTPPLAARTNGRPDCDHRNSIPGSALPREELPVM